MLPMIMSKTGRVIPVEDQAYKSNPYKKPKILDAASAHIGVLELCDLCASGIHVQRVPRVEQKLRLEMPCSLRQLTFSASDRHAVKQDVRDQV